MSAAIAAMVTAVVGVLGTLFAPLVASWVTKRQRDAEGLVEERRRLLEERRTAYTSMNRATSHFHTLLKDALHRTRDGVLTDEDRERLEEGRRDYRARYAEAQMIVPEAVLDSSREVNVVLAGWTPPSSASTGVCPATGRRPCGCCWTSRRRIRSSRPCTV